MKADDAKRIADDIRAICAPNNVPPDVEEFLRMAVAAAEGRPRIVTTPISRNDDEACREAFDQVFERAVANLERAEGFTTNPVDNPAYGRYIAEGFIIVRLCDFGFGSTNDLSTEGYQNRHRLFVWVEAANTDAFQLCASWRWREDSPKYVRRAKIQRRDPSLP